MPFFKDAYALARASFRNYRSRSGSIHQRFEQGQFLRHRRCLRMQRRRKAQPFLNPRSFFFLTAITSDPGFFMSQAHFIVHGRAVDETGMIVLLLAGVFMDCRGQSIRFRFALFSVLENSTMHFIFVVFVGETACARKCGVAVRNCHPRLVDVFPRSFIRNWRQTKPSNFPFEKN